MHRDLVKDLSIVIVIEFCFGFLCSSSNHSRSSPVILLYRNLLPMWCSSHFFCKPNENLRVRGSDRDLGQKQYPAYMCEVLCFCTRQKEGEHDAEFSPPSLFDLTTAPFNPFCSPPLPPRIPNSFGISWSSESDCDITLYVWSWWELLPHGVSAGLSLLDVGLVTKAAGC